MWSTRQSERDAERLHHAQLVATLAGERDAALRECAELRATVAGLEAQLKEHENDKAFYMGLWIDSQKGG
jgi:hypothetical protein